MKDKIEALFLDPIDFLAIGDITSDAFIRLSDKNTHTEITNKKNTELCMPFGDKVPFEFMKEVSGVGNSPNASVCAARLGLKSSLISFVGSDKNGQECLKNLKENKVNTDYLNISKDENSKTNYHYVLWYKDDRTILVNHNDYSYSLPSFPKPKAIYLSSLGKNTENFHQEILNYLNKNKDIKLFFQPGTFQMSLGLEKMSAFYEQAYTTIINVEEAMRILNIKTKNIKTLLKKFAELGSKIVLITDGPRGSYMRYQNKDYFLGAYPDPKPPLERTGCGDSFAATFASMIISGKNPFEALLYAPINPMSVVQYIGAQEGLLTRKQLDHFLHHSPDNYKIVEI